MGAVGLLRRGLRKLRSARKYPANTVHFLHVGKAAGTQVHQVVQQVNQSRHSRKLVVHGHETELRHVPPGQDYFFSTRDPATRFRSGFYSRLRKGQPRLYVEWSDQERLAFERFSHANELAEALFAPGKLGSDATAAMRSIRHCSRNLVDWFKFNGHMFEVRPPVWIVRQEHFAADLDVFLKRIGYEAPAELARSDNKEAHANNYEGIPDLSEKAMTNLRRWYAQDYAFLELCETWMAQARSDDADGA